MFTHADIWRGIDRLADAHGYSPSGLAKKAGLDPTAFNRSKRTSPDGKPRWPSTESIAKILAVTGTIMGDFIALISTTDTTSTNATAISISVIGFAQAGTNGYFDEEGYPAGDSWDDIPLPGFDNSKNERQYALRVCGDSMLPLYRKNDILVVAPEANIRKGDRVIVKTTGGEVLAKELIQRSSTKITLRSLNADYEDRALKMSEIHWIARILWTSQ